MSAGAKPALIPPTLVSDGATPTGSGGPLSPTRDTHRVVREQQFSMQRSDINTLLNFLHAQRTTGQLVIHLSQGGIQSVVLSEQQTIFADANLAK